MTSASRCVITACGGQAEVGSRGSAALELIPRNRPVLSYYSFTNWRRGSESNRFPDCPNARIPRQTVEQQERLSLPRFSIVWPRQIRNQANKHEQTLTFPSPVEHRWCPFWCPLFRLSGQSKTLSHLFKAGCLHGSCNLWQGRIQTKSDPPSVVRPKKSLLRQSDEPRQNIRKTDRARIRGRRWSPSDCPRSIRWPRVRKNSKNKEK